MNFPTDLDHTVRMSRTGDAMSVETLVHACYPAVYHLAVSILNDAHEAEDAAQEALLAAVTSLDRYRGEASFKTWIYAITINTCRGVLRKRKVRNSVMGALQAILPINGSVPTPEDAAAQSDSDRRLWAAVDSLDDKHRLPIVLRYAHDMTVPEIAGMIGISEGTVHSRLHYAREQLHRLLSREAAPRRREEARR